VAQIRCKKKKDVLRDGLTVKVSRGGHPAGIQSINAAASLRTALCFFLSIPSHCRSLASDAAGKTHELLHRRPMATSHPSFTLQYGLPASCSSDAHRARCCTSDGGSSGRGRHLDDRSPADAHTTSLCC
jgi:hypothetical protein